MRYRHANSTLRRMDENPDDDAGYAQAVARAFRMRMNLIRAARNEMDFYSLKSLHFEKLKGDRSHQPSMRLNRQFRLILEIEERPGCNVIVITDIEDYH